MILKILVQALPGELKTGQTPPPPAIAISGSASAASRSNFIGARCMRASVPTISTRASSSSRCPEAGLDARRLRNGVLDLEHRIAAASSPFAPPNRSQHVAELGIGRVDANREHESRRGEHDDLVVAVDRDGEPL